MLIECVDVLLLGLMSHTRGLPEMVQPPCPQHVLLTLAGNYQHHATAHGLSRRVPAALAPDARFSTAAAGADASMASSSIARLAAMRGLAWKESK